MAWYAQLKKNLKWYFWYVIYIKVRAFFFLIRLYFLVPFKVKSEKLISWRYTTNDELGWYNCMPASRSLYPWNLLHVLLRKAVSFLFFHFIGFASLSLSLFVFYQILLKFQRSAIPFLPTSSMQKLPIVSLQCEFIQTFCPVLIPYSWTKLGRSQWQDEKNLLLAVSR